MAESNPGSSRPGAGAALASLAQEAWDAEMASQPIFATSLGDRRFDERLRPNGPDAIAADVATASSLIERAEAIDPADIDATERVTRAALIEHLSLGRDFVAAGLEPWAVDPLDGPQVTFLNIASVQPIRDGADAEALLARWRQMAPWITRHIGSSREAMADGIVAPRALVRSVVAELDDLLAGPVEDWPLQDPARHLPDGLAPATAEAFRRDLPAVVADEIRPAFARYRAFLADELAPLARADDRPGLGSVPGGEAAYTRLVRSNTTLGLGPEAIHRIGL